MHIVKYCSCSLILSSCASFLVPLHTWHSPHDCILLALFVVMFALAVLVLLLALLLQRFLCLGVATNGHQFIGIIHHRNEYRPKQDVAPYKDD